MQPTGKRGVTWFVLDGERWIRACVPRHGFDRGVMAKALGLAQYRKIPVSSIPSKAGSNLQTPPEQSWPACRFPAHKVNCAP
jgi:hypothetical protein